MVPVSLPDGTAVWVDKTLLVDLADTVILSPVTSTRNEILPVGADTALSLRGRVDGSGSEFLFKVKDFSGFTTGSWTPSGILRATAVYGTAGVGTGVSGVASSGAGVSGTATSGHGVTGESSSGTSGWFRSVSAGNSDPTLVARRRGVSTANLVEAQSDAGSAVAGFDKDGNLFAANFSGGGGGVGTVTSVALTVPSEFSVTGSPITSSGTLAVSKATQAANKVFAGPTSGGAAQPTFRSLVSADIPNNAADTSGTAANISGTAAIAHGGTGQTTATAAFSALAPTTTKGDLIVDNGTDPVRLAVGTNGQVLTADSSVTEGVKWAAASSGPSVTAYVARWQIATIGASVFTGVGAATPSTSTDFGNNPVSDSSGTYAAEETGTTNGNKYVISWGGTSALCRHDQQPDVSVATKTGPSASDVTGLRMWPLFLGPSNPFNVDNSNNGCGFRFSPQVAGDTHFIAYSKDSTTAQTTDTGITPAAATIYVFRMVVGASDINYYINGTLVATHSTNVPGASTEHVFRTTLTTETGSTTRRLWVKNAYMTHA